MRFDRSQAPEARDPQAPSPEEAATPVDPHALLALQRSAGNAAVGRMLSRKFYAEAEDGSYVWHPEAVDEGQWEDTGRTTRGWLWTYPVYRPRPKAAEDGQGEAAAKSRRRRRRPKKTRARAPAGGPTGAAATSDQRGSAGTRRSMPVPCSG